MLGTVTMKSWFSDPGIIRQKHQFLYTPYYFTQLHRNQLLMFCLIQVIE